MIKKISVFILFFAAWLQVSYQSQFIHMLSKENLDATDYGIFTNEFRSFALLLALIILLGTIFFTQTQKQQAGANRYWYAGFLAILLLSSALVIYTNPQGRFPWNRRNAYIAIEARSLKFDLYKKLNTTPDLVLLGSSVSFQVPMNYIKEKWHVQSFNMAINGGGLDDYVDIINTIKKINPDSKMPAVVMVEISSPWLRTGGPDNMPVESIPFLNSMDQQRSALWKLFSTSFQINSFSDSVFTLLVIDRGHWSIPIIINKNDGTIERTGNENTITDEQYKVRVKGGASVSNYLQYCQRLNEKGKIALETLVQLSRANKFSIVFYRTPLNEDFFKYSRFKPGRYTKCSKLFDKYIKNIVQKNPNVFFKDLNKYKTITTGGKEMYIDTHHPTKRGSLLLLQTISDEIEAAFQWTRAHR